jgi:tRNA threonylcarbamoyladenosine biosynthesis protein TsaB
VSEVKSSGRIVLAADTSSPHAGFSITQGDRVLAALSSEADVPHSWTFFSNISILLRLANLEIGEIDAFAAVTGPGSFTGLRVGLAAIKGLSHTLGKPSVGVNSIDIHALSAGLAGRVLVVINAGREEVFWGMRDVDGEGTPAALGEDRVGSPASILERLNRMKIIDSAVIVGDGAARFRELCDGLRSSTHFSPSIKSWQLKTSNQEPAITLGQYAGKIINKGLLPEIHAYYVRPSDAEIKLSGRR